MWLLLVYLNIDIKCAFACGRYSLLTLVSEAICHLIYPFRWQVGFGSFVYKCSFIGLGLKASFI